MIPQNAIGFGKAPVLLLPQSEDRLNLAITLKRSFPISISDLSGDGV